MYYKNIVITKADNEENGFKFTIKNKTYYEDDLNDCYDAINDLTN